jgi:transcriptional regulator with XRE-family HTH domain
MAIERPSVKCRRCSLTQYSTKDGRCRRCGVDLPPVPVGASEIVDQFFSPAPPTEVVEVANLKPAEVARKIGLRIADARTRAGRTQCALEALSGVSRSYLSRIEDGQMTPSIGTLEKITEALEVSLYMFLSPNYAVAIPDPWADELLSLLSELSPVLRTRVFARIVNLVAKRAA